MIGPLGLGRGRALRQSLRVSAGGDVAEGFHSFITNERVLFLAGLATPVLANGLMHNRDSNFHQASLDPASLLACS
jgi:hypothetical protein